MSAAAIFIKLHSLGKRDRAVFLGIALASYCPDGEMELLLRLDRDEPHDCSPLVEKLLMACEELSPAQLKILIRAADHHQWIRPAGTAPANESGSALYDRNDTSDEGIAAMILATEKKIQTSKAALIAIRLLSSGDDPFPIGTTEIREKLEEFKIRPSSLTSTLDSLRKRGRPAIIGEEHDGEGLGYELTEVGQMEVSKLIQKKRNELSSQ